MSLDRRDNLIIGVLAKSTGLQTATRAKKSDDGIIGGIL